MEPQGYKTSTVGQLPESALYIVYSAIVTGLLAELPNALYFVARLAS